MRNRRAAVVSGLIVLAFGAAVGGGLGVLVKRPPAFYPAACAPQSSDLLVGPQVATRFGDLKNDVREKPAWGAAFTAAELNAFFRQALVPDGGLCGLLPDGLSDPRVDVAGDTLRVAARYGTGAWSTVVSVELRAWLVKDQTNTVAVELVGLWAGGLPIATQGVLDAVSEAARDGNAVVTWYRHAGHPVGVFRLYADQPRPATQLRRFQIADGALTVAGRTTLAPPGPPTAPAVRPGDPD